jgi:alpha-tubulin suppressor-like RCC1 family protein
MLNGVSHSPSAASGIFTDMTNSWWGAKWAEEAFQAGLIKECTIDPARTFCPNSGLDRALAAYMMVKAKNLPVTTISASGDHTCLRNSDGTVKCWGYNGTGQVGDGSNSNRNSPSDVVN